MATLEITQIRSLTDDAEGFSDIELQELLNAKGSVDEVARYVWRVKAAKTASLIDISESGSSRSLGDLHKQALSMSETFVADPAEAAPIKRSRRAVRR